MKRALDAVIRVAVLVVLVAIQIMGLPRVRS